MKVTPSIRIKMTRQRPSSPTTISPVAPGLSELHHDRIAMRAYEIYQWRTRQGPLDDWLQAEREILAFQVPR